ncbi:hypothetical protein CD187_18890 [Citrobacter youngae]|nr:hypothetical protein CD187_18890 [Citrobacter youngae]
MRGWRSEKVSTIREEFDEINDSMKGSSSRMKNKMGAQKGAFIKMKQENNYTYQRICMFCFVPIIGTIFSNKINWLLLHCFACLNTNVHFARCECGKIVATDDQYICFNELNNAK